MHITLVSTSSPLGRPTRGHCSVAPPWGTQKVKLSPPPQRHTQQVHVCTAPSLLRKSNRIVVTMSNQHRTRGRSRPPCMDQNAVCPRHDGGARSSAQKAAMDCQKEAAALRLNPATESEGRVERRTTTDRRTCSMAVNAARATTRHGPANCPWGGRASHRCSWPSWVPAGRQRAISATTC